MKKAKVISLNQLIPINYQSIDHEKIETVNARNVYEFLELETPFNKWIQRKIKRYDFIDGQDYVCWTNLSNKGEEGRNKPIEYYITMNMAKELSVTVLRQIWRSRHFYACGENWAKQPAFFSMG